MSATAEISTVPDTATSMQPQQTFRQGTISAALRRSPKASSGRNRHSRWVLAGLFALLCWFTGTLLLAQTVPELRLMLTGQSSALQVGTIEVEALVVQPRSDGSKIDQVRFELDGRVVVQRRTAPYTASVFVGRLPSEHRITAVALDAAGEVLASDELVLNRRRNAFTVDIASPQPGETKANGTAQVRLEVNTPADARLDRIELFLNEDLVHTFNQPPFQTEVAVGASLQTSFLRANAVLADGNSTEAISFLQQATANENFDVQYVQLYLAAREKRSQRPVLDLTREELAISEDGRAQTLRRFERVSDLPLSLAVLLDSSASMAPRMAQSVAAARTFFGSILQPKDRATLISFNDRPSLLVEFTAEIERLGAALDEVAAIKGTALYDSLVYGLYQLDGVKGQRAVLLLSDGSDESSTLRYSDALEYIRRAGIPLYAVRIEQGREAKRARAELEELTSTSGGRAFFIESATQLESAYRAIALELRSRFLATYQSNQQTTNRRFREIEVEVKRRGVEVSTQSGYYP